MVKLIRSVEEDCAIDNALEIIAKKWSPNIVLEFITEGASLSFSEIGGRIPEISPRMLSMRLKFLIEKNILSVIQNKDKPKKIRYELTTAGKSLAFVLEQIREWGIKFTQTNPKCVKNECRHGIAINKLIKILE